MTNAHRLSLVLSILLFIVIPSALATGESWNITIQNVVLQKINNTVAVQWEMASSDLREGAFTIIIADNQQITNEYLSNNPQPQIILSKADSYCGDCTPNMLLYNYTIANPEYMFSDGQTYFIGIGNADTTDRQTAIYDSTQAIINQQSITFGNIETESVSESEPIDENQMDVERAYIAALPPLDEVYSYPFPDVPEELRFPISFVYNEGIVHGYPDGTYRPLQTINRAELLKIILESTAQTNPVPEISNSNCSFPDVIPNEWYAKYICAAKERQIIQGYPDGLFRPENPVNFVEALKIIELAYEWDITVEPNVWYRSYIEQASGRNVIPLSIRSFDEQLTRGTMADMITRFVKNREQNGDLDIYLVDIGAQYEKITYECLAMTTCPVQNDTLLYEMYLDENQIQNFLDIPISEQTIEEKIVFAVNEDFANVYPDWENAANEIIDYMNTILAINTKKRLKIGRYVTYEVPPEDSLALTLQNIRMDPAFSLPNSSDDSLWGGLTIVYYVGPKFEEGGLGGFGGLGARRGKNYGTATIYDEEEDTLLRGKTYYEQQYGDNWEDSYSADAIITLHEVGHALGLAFPDWYLYDYGDLTNEAPLLDLFPYNVNFSRYPGDPMTNNPGESPRFSDLNALIINKNAQKQLTGTQIFSLLTRNVIVRVKDSNGDPVPWATVKVFGIKQGSIEFYGTDLFVLRQTIQTNENGEVTIKAPLGQIDMPPEEFIFIADLVKVSKNDKLGAGYVDTIMLQEARLINGSYIYYMDIVLH